MHPLWLTSRRMDGGLVTSAELSRAAIRCRTSLAGRVSGGATPDDPRVLALKSELALLRIRRVIADERGRLSADGVNIAVRDLMASATAVAS